MLPDRSKRAAGINGEIPRLQLATPWQMLMIVLISGGLLAMIFPYQALVEKLYSQEHIDDLSLSYIENLYRTDPQNFDLAILLVRARSRQMPIDTAEKMLQPVIISGSREQKTEARLSLLKIYEAALKRAKTPQLTTSVANRARLLIKNTSREDSLSPYLARKFADLAFRLNLPTEGAYYLHLSGEGQPLPVLEQRARIALGLGQFNLSSEYFMLARQLATQTPQARQLFHDGIAALMADQQFTQAMQMAETHIGNLARDPETLRYLARSALAAGSPSRAAYYAQRLISADLSSPSAGQP